jgi:hypothetical protein
MNLEGFEQIALKRMTYQAMCELRQIQIDQIYGTENKYQDVSALEHHLVQLLYANNAHIHNN